MTKRLLALAVCSAITATLTLGGAAKHAEHHAQSTGAVWTVNDRLPDAWSPYVREAVRDFNQHAPSGTPKLDYVDKPERFECTAGAVRREPTIVICADDGERNGVRFDGIALGVGTNSMTILINVNGVKTDAGRERVMCHELMHEVGVLPNDHYDSQPQSCVYGSLLDLGAWDISRLADLYVVHGDDK